MGEGRKVYKCWWESLREEDYYEDRVIDGRMRIEWMLGILGGWMWSGLGWLRIGTGDGLL
jgi:hypothetical protein